MTSRVRSWCGTRLPVCAMPGDRHAVDLAADLDRLLARPGAGRDAHGDLVGLGRVGRRRLAVDGVQAQEVDAQVLGLEA